MDIYYKGRFKITQAQIVKHVEKLGGTASRITPSLNAGSVCLVPKKDAETYEELGMIVVDEDWLDECIDTGKLVLPGKKDIVEDEEEYNPAEAPKEEEEEEALSAEEEEEEPLPGKRKVPAAAASGVPVLPLDQELIDAYNGVMDAKKAARLPTLPFKPSEGHVYVDDDGVVFRARTNQVQIDSNANKYYNMDLYVANGRYYTWFMWGRVGRMAGCSWKSHPNVDKAIAEFRKKFNDKTSLVWPEEREGQPMRANKYTPVLIDWSDSIPDAAVDKARAEQDAVKPEEPEEDDHGLPPPTVDLIRMITDKRMMQSALRGVDIDITAMPLGRLRKDFILRAFAVLESIARVIKGDTMGSVLALTNQFYSMVPVATPGIMTPPVIDSIDMVKRYCRTLETMYGIQQSMEGLSGGEKLGSGIGAVYKKLGMPLDVMDHKDPRFKTIQAFAGIKAPTHRTSLRVHEVFTLNPTRGTGTAADNRQILWHGSRAANFVGILSQGLRIAPPEAPATGYMFGKGLYFADISTKSWGYTYPALSHGKGLMILSEVDLGKVAHRYQSDYHADQPNVRKGDSILGQGKYQIKKSDERTLDGFPLQCGPVVEEDDEQVTLMYNEMIVYDTKRVNMRYLLLVSGSSW